MSSKAAQSFVTAGLALCVLGVVACGDESSVRPVEAIVVRNLTADSIAVMLIEREDSYLVDPVPERPATEEGDRLIVPGGERRFSVDRVVGYAAGKDILVFLYRIRSGRSVFAGVRDASNASLRMSGYVVEIPASAFQ